MGMEYVLTGYEIINMGMSLLGKSHNEIAHAIQNADFYGMDGDGFRIVYRIDDEIIDEDDDYSCDDIINQIMHDFFKKHPDLQRVYVAR